MPNALAQGEIRSRPVGPREGIVRFFERILGDNRGARETAETITGALETVTPVGTVNAAYDLPGQAAEAIRNPSVQSGLAAALTAGSLIPFANPLAKAARGAAKDAGRTAHIFAGPMAERAPLEALEQFGKHEGRNVLAGTPAAMAWRDLGWNINKHGQPFWEIGDDASVFKPRDFADKKFQGTYELQDVFHHPELYKNYPGIRQAIAVKILPGSSKELGFNGGWDAKTGTIELPFDIANDPKQAKSTILHEIQHVVQEIEGFPRGSSPGYSRKLQDGGTLPADEDPYSLYNRAAGEVEARNVQTRQLMGPAGRRNNAPFNTQDVPFYRQIVYGADRLPVGEVK